MFAYKAQGKFIPVHATKAHGGRVVIAPFILNLNARLGGEWPASHPGCFTAGKIPWCQFSTTLGGPRSGSGRFGGGINGGNGMTDFSDVHFLDQLLYLQSYPCSTLLV
jgi:hypothetical protein